MLLAVVAAFALAWLPLYLTFTRLKFATSMSEEESEFWKVCCSITILYLDKIEKCGMIRCARFKIKISKLFHLNELNELCEIVAPVTYNDSKKMAGNRLYSLIMIFSIAILFSFLMSSFFFYS